VKGDAIPLPMSLQSCVEMRHLRRTLGSSSHMTKLEVLALGAPTKFSLPDVNACTVHNVLYLQSCNIRHYH